MASLPVLMYKKHVEPIFLPHITTFRHIHLDPITSQLIVHSRVFDVANTVHGQMGITLLEQDRLDADAFIGSVGLPFIGCEVDLAKVVDDARHGQDI